MPRSASLALVVLALAAVASCDRAPGRPPIGAQYTSPDRTLDFTVLYRTNCAGCHGLDGRGGAALALANPIYLAIADDVNVRRATADGIRGTAMPAFASASGGLLADAQVDAIVSGIRRWSSHSAPAEEGLPPYADATPGDAQRGAAVFVTFCERCHGPGGRGGPGASSIVDPSYLALVSDQGLRTTIIAGRPELGAPDSRENVPGRAMTSEEIADVVAWLSAQRPPSGDSPSGS